MTNREYVVHRHTVSLTRSHRKVESQLIQALCEVIRLELYKKLDKPTLFMYLVGELKFSEPTAYAFSSVARLCVRIPELLRAIADQRLTVAKASRLVSIMTEANATEILAFAEKASWREIEREVARRNPKAAHPDRAKYISENLVHLSMTISHDAYQKHLRVKALEAQRGNSGEFQEVLYDEYLLKHDKVKKAERAKTRQTEKAERSVRTEKRQPIPAESQNIVYERDQGRCTHVDKDGNRCNEDQWIEIHHIVPVSEGGTNDPDNLTTLCSFHHKAKHRYTQRPPESSFVRSPSVSYCVNS